ncbi:MAG: nuclear transport factor 2 family protein [Actinobacteria bacterium]|nr:nuclear transport factor 2 family protein [Actinomycetota bacterium]
MASHDVAETVRNYYRLVDSGELERMLELFSADTVYHRPGYEPLRGQADLRRFYSSERVIESGEHELEDPLTSGDRVAVQGVFRGVLKDGKSVEFRFAEFFSVRDDRIVERRSYFFTPLV